MPDQSEDESARVRSPGHMGLGLGVRVCVCACTCVCVFTQLLLYLVESQEADTPSSQLLIHYVCSVFLISCHFGKKKKNG